MGGVGVPQAPRRVGYGRGIPLLTEGRVWGGGCAPSLENFFVFF